MSFSDEPGSAGTGEPAPAGGEPGPAGTGSSLGRGASEVDPAPMSDAPVATPASARADERQRARANMLPGRKRRRFALERILVRLIATGGVIGIGVVLAAILASSKVQGWIIGLVVATVSVVLSAVLWSSRQL